MNYFLNLLEEGRVHLYDRTINVQLRIYQRGIHEQYQSKFVSNYYGSKRLRKSFNPKIEY